MEDGTTKEETTEKVEDLWVSCIILIKVKISL